MNQNLNVFKVADDNTPLNFDINSIGRFGFIIPKKYENKTIYLPSDFIEEKSFVHHGSVLKFTLWKLFKCEKDNFFKDFITIKSTDDDIFYMDSEEIAYSSFIASLDSIVFLNTSTNYLKSGIIFIPNNLEKNDIRNEKINEIINYLSKEKNITSYVVTVPSLKEAISKNKKIKLYELDEYKSLKARKNDRNNKSLIKKNINKEIYI